MLKASNKQAQYDYIDASVTHLPELTLRACILAVLITIVFTAGNVYMGLKISFTFNSAIPAAVISMAVLQAFKNSNMLENTTVQTFASAAGTLSAVIFVVPGLVMLGFWTAFPYWQTALICATGGLLGVMFTIPLRRALVVQSDLPYPEGVAAAEILRIGNKISHMKELNEKDKESTGVKEILWGSLIAGFFTLFSRGFHWLSESFAYFFKIGAGFTGVSIDYSLALIGAGYLIRIRVGIAMLIGVLIAWAIMLPYLSWNMPINGSIVDTAMKLWVTKVRFLGVGTIAIAALWTIVLLLKPIWAGIESSLQALAQVRLRGKESVLRTENDIPITTVFFSVIALLFPLFIILGYFIMDARLPISTTDIIILTSVCVFFIVIMSFITASVCGYMAGLTGSSNSPVSSIALVATIGASFLLLLMLDSSIHEKYSNLTIALVLYMVSAVLAAACVSNDNMQDLKTGQLLGATPWRQQVALVLGVLVGSMVIPFILQTLYTAYGFPGSLPRADMNPAEALSAPQAVMMTAIASGIITHNLEWTMVFIGAAIGVAFIIFDATILKYYNLRLSIVALGSGIYLPVSATASIILGSFVSFFIEIYLKKRALHKKKEPEEFSKSPLRRGTLLASGFIVGESLVGVAIALVIAFSGNQYPLQLVGPEFEPIAKYLGVLIFLGILVFNYYYVTRQKEE